MGKLYERPNSSCVMWYSWWGCRRNLKLITLGNERVKALIVGHYSTLSLMPGRVPDWLTHQQAGRSPLTQPARARTWSAGHPRDRLRDNPYKLRPLRFPLSASHFFFFCLVRRKGWRSQLWCWSVCYSCAQRNIGGRPDWGLSSRAFSPTPDSRSNSCNQRTWRHWCNRCTVGSPYTADSAAEESARNSGHQARIASWEDQRVYSCFPDTWHICSLAVGDWAPNSAASPTRNTMSQATPVRRWSSSISAWRPGEWCSSIPARTWTLSSHLRLLRRSLWVGRPTGKHSLHWTSRSRWPPRRTTRCHFRAVCGDVCWATFLGIAGNLTTLWNMSSRPKRWFVCHRWRRPRREHKVPVSEEGVRTQKPSPAPRQREITPYSCDWSSRSSECIVELITFFMSHTVHIGHFIHTAR